jgi:mannose/fructose/sorbose-specific phosphotransferase system IIA component
MIGIVITTHGPLAEGLFESLRFFSGDMGCLTSVVLNDEDEPESFFHRLEAAVQSVDQSDGIVILTDILGGTPFNQSMMLAIKRSDIRVITGVNLMMLIEAVLSRDNATNLDEFSSRIIRTAKESIAEMTGQYRSGSELSIDDSDQFLED